VDTFLDLKAEERWPEAARRIEPAPEVYLQTSRITNSKGHLDVVNEQLCAGWAFYPQQPNKAARVQIFINDVLCHIVEAAKQRSDVKAKNIHPTGLCGFRFEWPPDKRPKLGDRIVVQVEGDINPISKISQRVSRAQRDQVITESAGDLPSFYCIGAQKAGTTWLFEMLKKHPEIHLPQYKEVHYWDLNKTRSLQWYRDHFKPEYLNGDITPAYAILPEASVTEIHSLTPKAKILFSMRHPIERAWSFVQMVVKQQYKVCPDNIKRGNPQGEELAFIRQNLFHPGCLARSNYAETIRRWRKQFGEEAVMCFRFERITQSPRELLTDICQHIGADPVWVETLPSGALKEEIFSSERIPFPSSLKEEFTNKCTPFIDDLEHLLEERFDDWRT
jgi:hypothetical protein